MDMDCCRFIVIYDEETCNEVEAFSFTSCNRGGGCAQPGCNMRRFEAECDDCEQDHDTCNFISPGCMNGTPEQLLFMETWEEQCENGISLSVMEERAKELEFAIAYNY